MKGNRKQKGELEAETRYGYEDFVKQVKNKLTNNLLWKFEGFSSDKDKIQDEEMIKQIEELMEKKDKLFQINSEIFDELKKVYNIASQYNSNPTAAPTAAVAHIIAAVVRFFTIPSFF